MEIDFTGKVKETGEVFDTTEKKIAKENDLDDKVDYKPVIICVGQSHIFNKVEDYLVGKDIEKRYKIELSAEESFGKKDAKKIKLVPSSIFRKNKINPMVGLGVTINDSFGIIRTVAGGRCMVDFNHPLSGKDIIYEIRAEKIIKDPIEKIKALIEIDLKINDFKVEKSEKGFTVEFEEKISKLLTSDMKKRVEERVKELTGNEIKIK